MDADGKFEVPKTLIFAKSDSHADDIINIVREEFAEENKFCKKITYRTRTEDPKTVLQQFRNELLSAHCRDGGYDRYRYRYPSAGSVAVYARCKEPQLLRADERPRYPHLQPRRIKKLPAHRLPNSPKIIL